jgi:DMSO/TMAO reductase YedYZ molybdopterin-dependent catalytic subunit
VILATRLGGQELDAGHGFSARLVAPDRRGFWWVKWVSSIQLDGAPAWWQLPFPVQ